MIRVILLIFFPIFLFGQNIEITGEIIDGKTKAAIAYANIGVLNKNIGTVSNDKGVFVFKLSEKIKATDTIKISMIGYESRIFEVVEFQQLLNKNKMITLESKGYNLSEITVIPKGTETDFVGNEKRNKRSNILFNENNLGREMALLMKIKKRPTHIDKVFINITTCTYDSIFYRLNIYEYDKKTKLPTKNLLPEPVYINFTKAETEETLEIDISDLNVLVQDDFVVSLELVKDLGEGKLMFSASFFKSKGFVRLVSQGKWTSTPIIVGAGIYTEIRYKK